MYPPKDINLNLNTHKRLLRASLYNALSKAILAQRSQEDPLRVLDVGCGRGELLHILSEKGCKVTGVDLNKECVDVAAQYASCVQGSFVDLSKHFQPGDFDVIVTSHVIEHVQSPITALTSLRGMNAKGYILAIPNIHRSSRIIRLLLGSARGDHPTHYFGWGRAEFSALLNASGFEIVQWYTDRVSINPFQGAVGAKFTKFLAPIEERFLPHLFPLLSSSLIVSCKPC